MRIQKLPTAQRKMRYFFILDETERRCRVHRRVVPEAAALTRRCGGSQRGKARAEA